jgi:hypothetical protein
VPNLRLESEDPREEVLVVAPTSRGATLERHLGAPAYHDTGRSASGRAHIRAPALAAGDGRVSLDCNPNLSGNL